MSMDLDDIFEFPQDDNRTVRIFCDHGVVVCGNLIKSFGDNNQYLLLSDVTTGKDTVVIGCKIVAVIFGDKVVA